MESDTDRPSRCKLRKMVDFYAACVGLKVAGYFGKRCGWYMCQIPRFFAIPSSHMAHYMGVTARGKHGSVGDFWAQVDVR